MKEEIQDLLEEKEEAIGDIKELQCDLVDYLGRFEKLINYTYHKDYIKPRYQQTIDKFLSLIAELGYIKSDYEQAYIDELKKYEL